MRGLGVVCIIAAVSGEQSRRIRREVGAKSEKIEGKSRKNEDFSTLLGYNDEDTNYWRDLLQQSITSSPTASPTNLPRDIPHVGIIGAGAAGLTSAYLLMKKGYHVTVLEKAAEVGGFAKTNVVQGKAYDMSTMFVPGGSIAGAGIEPTLKELIDVSAASISPAVDFFTLNVEHLHLDVIPEPLQEYEPEDIVSQVLTGLGLSTQLLLCLLDVSNCASCEVCADADMPLLSWGDKWGAPAYAKLATYVFDGLGSGPTAFVSTFTNTLSSFLAVDAAFLLRNLGVTMEALPEKTPPNIVSLLTSERWYFFDDGFQVFWKQLVEKANINVIVSYGVSEMGYDAGSKRWQLKDSSGEEQEFDQIIVTSAPQDSLKFLPDGAQKTLIETSVPLSPPNDIFLFRISDYNGFADTNMDDETVAFWPTGFGQGTTNLANPNGYPSKATFWQKRHDLDVFLTGTYNLANQSPEDAFDIVRNYGRDILALDIEELLHHERYVFPSVPADRTQWDNGWATLQGRDGLWFNGEAFSGSGVPRVTQFTKGLMAAFPDLE